jgi:hypothetical protein
MMSTTDRLRLYACVRMPEGRPTTRGPFFRALCTAFLAVFAAASPGLAQVDSEAQAVKSLLSGQTMMVTYRDGGALYGTYYQIYVAFCPSGTYFTKGGSSRTTILNNEERHSFSDQGKWSVAPLGQVVVVQYRSASGQVTAFPVHLLSNGGLWAGNGITVVPQGPTPCK